MKAEVGSEHCNSDGHITDNEDPSDNTQDKTKNSEIQVLKDCLIRQVSYIQPIRAKCCYELTKIEKRTYDDIAG